MTKRAVSKRQKDIARTIRNEKEKYPSKLKISKIKKRPAR